MLAAAIALRPDDFNFGREAPDGSSWRVLGEDYPTNPRMIVPPWAWTMLKLRRMTRGGQIAGMGFALSLPGQLLEPGGVMDQSPYMADCFAAMDAAEAAFRKEVGEDNQT